MKLMLCAGSLPISCPFFCQYQNVFAPLIKLEADYDKVLCSDYEIMFRIFSITKLNCVTVLYVVTDDERVTEQG